jgi:hypothetical protein
MPVPTLAADGDTAAFVRARVAEGSDYIKVVVDDDELLQRCGVELRQRLHRPTGLVHVCRRHRQHR